MVLSLLDLSELADSDSSLLVDCIDSAHDDAGYPHPPAPPGKWMVMYSCWLIITLPNRCGLITVDSAPDDAERAGRHVQPIEEASVIPRDEWVFFP